LPTFDAAGFQRGAAEHKGDILERPWILPSRDPTIFSPSYEETFIGILRFPVAEEMINVTSNIRPAID
jgi:hypothetical protein